MSESDKVLHDDDDQSVRFHRILCEENMATQQLGNYDLHTFDTE